MTPTLVTASLVTLVLTRGTLSFPWPRQAMYFFLCHGTQRPRTSEGIMLRRASRASPGLPGWDQGSHAKAPPRRLNESKIVPCCCFFPRSSLDFHGNYVLWVIDLLATVIHGTRYPNQITTSTSEQQPRHMGVIWKNPGYSDGSDGIVTAQR